MAGMGGTWTSSGRRREGEGHDNEKLNEDEK
jgi:hypothetical protein